MIFKRFIEKLSSHSHSHSHSNASNPNSSGYTQLIQSSPGSIHNSNDTHQENFALETNQTRTRTRCSNRRISETNDSFDDHQLHNHQPNCKANCKNEEDSENSNFGSSCSSSGYLNHDHDDLHLHHDHNTKFIYKNQNHSNKILIKLHEMRKFNQQCDVKIIVDNEEINCHKSILVANSPYFLAMFSSGLAESSLNRIVLKEVESDALKLLIDYMYTGELLITETNVQSLLITSNLLDITNIKDSCGQFIQSQLDITNCLGIREFADMHSCKVLEKHAEAFIEQYFSDVTQKEEFLALNVDQVIKLISKDNLSVSSEKIVYDCVLKWINHDHDSRYQYLEKLMQHVRFGLLKQEDLVYISEDPIIKKNLICMEFIVEAFQYKMIKSNKLELQQAQSDSSKIRNKPRVPLGLPKIMYLFGGQAPKAIAKVEIYDFRSQEWLNCEDMPTKRCRAGCIYFDGLIYIIGGFNGQTRVRSVDIYNPQTKEWSVGPDMLCRRGTLGVGLLNNKVYAVGGFDGVTGLTSVECWNMKTNQNWTMVAPLSTRRSSVGIAVLNNYLYAIGGYCGLSRECLDSVEKYDQSSDCWCPVPSMSTRRSGACVNVYGGKIYVVGGHNGPEVLKCVEVYDPFYNKWELISELNVARRNAGFIIHNGLFYIIGGDDGQNNLTSVEIYNPQRNVWSLLPSFLTEAKSYTSCLVIENYFN